MKSLILALPLLLVAPSCETVRSLAAVPAAVVSDVGSGVDALTPGEQATVDAVSSAAQTGGTIIGGPAVGGAAGVLATLLATWALKKRKKAKA